MDVKKIEGTETVAKKLKQLRNEANLSQNEVAEKLGITQQTYSKYENGLSSLDAVALKSLCEFYGVTSDYVLGLDEDAYKTESVEKIQSAYIDTIVNQVVDKIKKGEK